MKSGPLRFSLSFILKGEEGGRARHPFGFLLVQLLLCLTVFLPGVTTPQPMPMRPPTRGQQGQRQHNLRCIACRRLCKHPHLFLDNRGMPVLIDKAVTDKASANKANADKANADKAISNAVCPLLHLEGRGGRNGQTPACLPSHSAALIDGLPSRREDVKANANQAAVAKANANKPAVAKADANKASGGPTRPTPTQPKLHCFQTAPRASLSLFGQSRLKPTRPKPTRPTPTVLPQHSQGHPQQ